MTARAAILAKIQKANDRSPTAEEAYLAWKELPRSYCCVAGADRESVILLLEGRLRDYEATVARCCEKDAVNAVESILAGRSKRRILLPEGIPSSWLPMGIEFVVDRAFDAQALNRFEGVLTCASVAVAETGTVVLQNRAGQGRRAVTLVPDYHLCVVRMDEVVATVPEAISRLQATSHLATTFISGPSATADIEMTRIKGVHGPRVLDVLLME